MLKFRHQVRKNNYCIQKYHFKSIEVGRFNSLNPYLKTNQTNESKPDKSFKKIGLLKRDKNIKKKRKKKAVGNVRNAYNISASQWSEEAMPASHLMIL